MLLRYRVTSPLGLPHVDWLGLPQPADDADPVNLVQAAPFDHRRHAGLSFTPCPPISPDAAVSCRVIAPPLTEVDDDGTVTFIHNLEWTGPDGSPLISEARRIRTAPPAQGRYRLDFSTTLRTTGDRIVLRSSDAPSEADGLFVRLIRSIRAHATDDPASAANPRYIHLAGELDGLNPDGRPRAAGLALLNPPTNPMVLIVDPHDPPGWMSARWVSSGVALGPKEGLALRWGLLVHQGRLATEDFAQARAAFADAGG